MALTKWSDNIAAAALQGNYDGYIQSSLLQLRLTGPIGSNPANGTAVYNITENTTYKVRLYMDTRFRVAACASIAMNTVMTNYYRDAGDKSDTTVTGAYKEAEITSEAGQVYMPVVYWASGGSKTWSEVYDTIEVYKQLTGTLELTTPPAKTQYNVGEELDLTGMVVSVVWSDGTKEAVTDYTVSGFDSSVAGSCTVTVAYQGASASFDVTVALKGVTVTGIRITHTPDIVRYEVGADLDSTGLEVTADLSDGSTQVVTNYTLSGYDSAAIGTKTITATYQGHTATFVVTVYSLSSIAITTLPAKVQYNVGDTLDLTGMVVTAAYSDGVAEAVTDYTTSGFDNSVAGTRTVTVTYQGASAGFDVTVVEAPVPGIAFESLLNTTEGMEVNRNNVKNDDGTDTVTGVDWFTYAGNVCSSIYVSGNNWMGFGTSSEQLKICRRDGAVYYVYRQEGVLDGGTKFLKIRVEGYTYYSATTDAYKLIYEVFLFDDGCLYINAVQSPTNNNYIGTSSITDGTNTATLNIPVSVTAAAPVEITVEGAGSAQNITYGRYVPFVAASMEIAALPDKTIYYGNELFDSTGLVVSLVDATGKKKIIDSYALSGFDSSTPGIKSITATSGSISAIFEVRVSDISITGIEVTSLPDKVEFNYKGPLDLSGIVVSFVLSNGSKVPTLLYDVSGFNNTIVGENDLVVSYNGMETTFAITISSLFTIAVTSLPTKTVYKVGESLDASGMVVTATYSDGSTGNITGYVTSALDSSTVGVKNVTVSYRGTETKFTVQVIPVNGSGITVDSLLDTTDGMDVLISTSTRDSSLTMDMSGYSFVLQGRLVKKIIIRWNVYQGSSHSDFYMTFYDNEQTSNLTTITEAYFFNTGWSNSTHTINMLCKQLGKLNNGIDFLKVYVWGNNGGARDTEYKYEFFLFSNSDMSINVIKKPYSVSSSYHSISINGTRYNFTQYIGKQTLFSIEDGGNKYYASNLNEGYHPVLRMLVSTPPTKTVFYKGDTKKFEGMAVSLVLENGSLVPVYSSSYTISYEDEAGMQVVGVALGSYNTSFDIKVLPDAIITLSTRGFKTHYVKGTQLSSFTLIATWGSGKTENIADGYIVSGYDPDVIGTQTVTIGYAGVTIETEVTVTESAVFTVALDAELKFLVGIDEFYSSGISGKIVFSDGYEEYVYSSDMRFLGFSNDTVGIITMTAEYEGFAANFQVEITDTISENIGEPNETDVVASLNVVSGILTVSGTGETRNFSHSRDDDLFYGGYSEYAREIVIGEGITKLGSLFPHYSEVEKATLPNTLTHILYQYNGCFQDCDKLKEINVPESLTVINGFRGCTGLTDIELGENVAEIGDGCFSDCPNLVVTIKNKECVIYDGYSLQVKLIKGYSGSTAEEYAAANTIPFDSIDTITSITVYSVPYKVTYFALEKELDTSGLVIQGITDSGTSVTLTTYSVGAVDFSTAGTKTVTVSYKGLTTTFDISVINPSFESIYNSTTGMADGTTASASWFMYNGIAAESISCRNGILKFNGAEERVSVCALAYSYESYYSYMLETILDNGIRVLKFRTHYLTENSMSAHVEHEIFLFSTNDIYINVIRMPDDGSTVGDIGNAVGKLVSNGKEYNFNFKKGKPAKRSCYHLDSTGLDWNIKAEEYVFPVSPIRAEVIKLPDKIDYFIGDPLDATGMSVELIFSDGTREVAQDYTTEYDFNEAGIKDVKVIDKSGMSVVFQVCVNVRINIGYPVKSDVVGISDIRQKVLYINGGGATSDGAVLESDFPAPVRTATEKVIISDGITRIGNCTFSLFSNIKEVTGLDKIQEIGAYAFYYNKKIYGTLHLDRIVKIGGNAFDTCEGIEHIEIEKTAKTIGEYAFNRMASLKEIRINKLKDTIAGAPWGASNAQVIWRQPVTGIRIARYPSKIYYKLNETLNTEGLEVVEIRADGKEYKIDNYSLSEFDSTSVGNKEINVSYGKDEGDGVTSVHFAEFSVKVTATGDNPFEDNLTPYKITVHWPNGEFTDLGNDDLTGTMTLQESICSNNYFIFGGCICNQISFTTLSKQFMSADEDATPHGDIEVYVESRGTKVKIFTGTIDSGKRTAGLTQRNIIAYDYLYKFRNTDVAWWYKNKTADKNMILTQKQFRDQLFDYLGIEQVPAKLYYDDALVPDTNQANEINVANVLKDLCLQNSVFGWVNRDGKFEYLKLPHNSRVKSMDNAGNLKYAYYDAQVYVDTYESCEFSEGRIWYPKEFLSDPPVGMFTPGGLTAQEAYEANVYYNRNSFFVGDSDWLDSAFQGDEYGAYTVMEPIFPVCYGTTSKTDNQHLYRAQGYTLTLRGNPLNKVGDSIEITVRKTAADGTQLEWVIHSYIMSRTLKLTGDTSMTDVYSAKNGPYNGNDSQAGNNTAEHSAELFRLRSEGPTISYAPFTDGAATLAAGEAKKDRLRCVKSLTEAEYTALQTAGSLRTDTLYFIKE